MKNFLINIKKIPKNVIWGLALASLIIYFFWLFLLKDIISDIETISYDWRARIATENSLLGFDFSRHDENIILVAADDYSTDSLKNYPELNIGRWPWRREIMGQVAKFISSGKPKAVVFDIKFEGKEGSTTESVESDRFFSDVIKNNKVILATALTNHRQDKSYKKLINSFESAMSSAGKNLYDLSNYEIDKAVYSVHKQLGKITEPPAEKFNIFIEDNYFEQSLYKNDYARTFFDNITFFNQSNIVPDFLSSTAGLGVINLKSSENSVFRNHVPLYRLVHDQGVSYLPSLPLAAVLSVVQEEDKKPVLLEKNKLIIGNRHIPVTSEGELLLNWHGGPGTYKTIPISKVILSQAYQNKQIEKINEYDKLNPELFRDKIVVIGQTSAGTDVHPTPMASIYPGPEIIVTAIDNLLNDADITNKHRRKFIVKSHFVFDLLLSLFLGFLICYGSIKHKSNIEKLKTFVYINLLFVVIAVVMFVHPDIRIWINMVYPLLFFFLVGLSSYAYQTYVESNERKMVENLFGKFVSPQILEKLLTERKEISQEGQRKVMTVLFSDIRGFTSLSEKNSADEVIKILNEYITEMVEIILEYDGTLDKYIGDAIMAFYNDPVEMENHALVAVKTAIRMKEKLFELNEKWVKEGRQPLDIGIGINTGEMIVGHMGSHRLVDYTVIGDNVNLASRIENLTKDYETNILISESTYMQVKEQVDCIFRDEVKVKGKDVKVRIYEVISLKDLS